MEIIHTVKEIRTIVESLRNESKTIGFVPTMGALHAGHISLVSESCRQNNITIVSIFVNPTQFNNAEDLEKYPRTLDQDTLLLEKSSVDIVFAPTVDEIYPEPDTRNFQFDGLDDVMEGKFRPGHFNGVAQVVSRLFEIVSPNKAYFGEKDFQQLAIIRLMVKQSNLPVDIVSMPIKREGSGLAMSSRNQRLSESERKAAAAIYAALRESISLISFKSVLEVQTFVVKKMDESSFLKVEYFEIVDGNTLQSISNWESTTYAVGCIAVFCGEVRLIDNITYFK